MKLAHIVGNRPQFIKLSLLQGALAARGGSESLIVHTGQHFHDNMSSIFFREFGIPPPDHQLHINTLPHGEMIGRMLIDLDMVLALEKPDGVIVYGDTNTTLSGALAAKKRGIPLIHVEAGIRTGQENMPEESNRYLSDRMATLNFTCTSLGLDNLLKEGAHKDRVCNSGDLMLDAALRFKDRALAASTLVREIFRDEKTPFVLATIHRAENSDDPVVLGRILRALEVIDDRMPVVFPMHPKTAVMIAQHRLPGNFRVVPALGYFDMLALVQSCRYVITDSGGLSRESFFFRKPSLVIMETPFWPEILQHGPSLRADADTEDIVMKFERLDKGGKDFEPGIFGDGKAGERISERIVSSEW